MVTRPTNDDRPMVHPFRPIMTAEIHPAVKTGLGEMERNIHIPGVCCRGKKGNRE
jgi:hypothetical protein